MILLDGQHGAALRSDVAASIGERPLRTALATGSLKQIWRGVIVRGTDELDLRTRAAAALLLAKGRGVLSGPTALALHGLSAADDHTIHLTVPQDYGMRSKPGLHVQRRDFGPDDVADLDGLLVFRRELALADVLCTGDDRQALACLDQALGRLSPRRGQALRLAIREELSRRKDPRGVARAVMLADLATGKADSPPESQFLLILTEAGLPVPQAQWPVRTIDGRLLCVLDLAWPELRIAFEYDGYAAHEERGEADQRRDERLTGRGWIIVRARAVDLSDPRRVLAELRAAFRRRTS